MFRIYYNKSPENPKEGDITEITTAESEGDFILVEDEEAYPFMEGVRSIDNWCVDIPNQKLKDRNIVYYDDNKYKEEFRELAIFDESKQYTAVLEWDSNDEVFFYVSGYTDEDLDDVYLYVTEYSDPNVLYYKIHVPMKKLHIMSGRMIFYCNVDLPEKFSVYGKVPFDVALRIL